MSCYYSGLYRLPRSGIDIIKFQNFLDLFCLELDNTNRGCIFNENVDKAWKHFDITVEGKRSDSWETFAQKAEDPTASFCSYFKGKQNNPFGGRFELELCFADSKDWRWAPTDMKVDHDELLTTFVEYLRDIMESANTSEELKEKYRELYNDYLLIKKEENDIDYVSRHLFYLKLYQALGAISFAYYYEFEWGELYRYITGTWDYENPAHKVDTYPFAFGSISPKSTMARYSRNHKPLYVFHGIDCLM